MYCLAILCQCCSILIYKLFFYISVPFYNAKSRDHFDDTVIYSSSAVFYSGILCLLWSGCPGYATLWKSFGCIWGWPCYFCKLPYASFSQREVRVHPALGVLPCTWPGASVGCTINAPDACTVWCMFYILAPVFFTNPTRRPKISCIWSVDGASDGCTWPGAGEHTKGRVHPICSQEEVLQPKY